MVMGDKNIIEDYDAIIDADFGKSLGPDTWYIGFCDKDVKMVCLTEEEKYKFTEWIIQNVSNNIEKIIPMDEGNEWALIYNLVHFIKGDGLVYNYLPEQDEEISNWEYWREKI